MADKVVEPSEIIVDVDEVFKKEDVSHVNPWIRFIGRFFDYSLFVCCLWLLRYFLGGHFPFGKFEYLIPFEYFVWIPIEALLYFSIGTTPGKFLLGTKLVWGKNKRPDYFTALKRSFSVWFRGMGMGIPVINVFCLMVAYQKLKLFGLTSWDRDDQVKVTHRPIGIWRMWLAILLTLAGLLFYYSNKNTAVQAQAKKGESGRVF